MSQTKDFKAVIHPGTTGFIITVKGEVNCGMLEIMPILTKAEPQGINPDILLLDVYPASTDENGAFRPADYNENIAENDTYTEVQLIDSSGNTIEVLPVQAAHAPVTK